MLPGRAAFSLIEFINENGGGHGSAPQESRGSKTINSVQESLVDAYFGETNPNDRGRRPRRVPPGPSLTAKRRIHNPDRKSS